MTSPTWQDGGYEVYHADCLDIMPGWPDGSFDAVVTDPPWPGCKLNVGYSGAEWWEKVVAHLERLVGPEGKVIVVAGSDVDPRLMTGAFTLPFVHMGWIRWKPARCKGNIFYSGDVFYEFGRGFCPKGRKILFQEAGIQSNKWRDYHGHPCPRNLGHMRWLIDTQVGPGRRVLDPFSGIGTISVACVHAGAECVSIDRDEKWARITSRETYWALESVGQPTLAEGSVQKALF